jgi:phosphatidylserine decarboxylase
MGPVFAPPKHAKGDSLGVFATRLDQPHCTPENARHMRSQTLYEARWIFAVLAFLGIAGAFVSVWLFVPVLLLVGYVFWFFRDPERVSPADPDAVVAAADGKVADIVEVEEPEVVHALQKRVGIFLSVVDVHTNRAPVEGKLIYRKEHAGLCLDARHADCTTKNRAVTWAFQNQRGTFVVRQLTGMIARRIVGWSRVGDDLKKGERFGMIRFGSRTEVYLPLDAEVLVKVGDRVVGGVSVIARLR